MCKYFHKQDDCISAYKCAKVLNCTSRAQAVILYTSVKFLCPELRKMSSRGYSACEILEVLETLVEEDDVGQVDVYLDHPGDGQQSEGDSGDEDCSDINRLSRAQLQSNAQLNRSESPENENVIEPEVVQPGPSRIGKSKSSKKPTRPVRKWIRKVMIPTSESWKQPLPRAVLSLGPECEAIQFFQLFFGSDVVENFGEENDYLCHAKNNPKLFFPANMTWSL
ncbi:hypothetical protein evm_011068 [Chilo suppressalis]|nr:hypothetical protein evm_011068 [Chilo suppressalis]